MKNSLINATKNFSSSINLDIEKCNDDKIEGYITEIDLIADKHYKIYLIIPYEKLKYVSNFYFQNDDEIDIKDLAQEITNQIVGNAKTILVNNQDKNYQISTPKFLGEYKENQIEYDEKISFKFNNHKCFHILIKEVDE